MNTETLRIWVEKNDIINQTFDSFYQCLNLYKKESPEEFVNNFGEYDKKKLELFLESVDLRIINFSTMLDDEIISTLRIIYEGKYLGQYKLVLDLNGEIIDDVFVIE